MASSVEQVPDRMYALRVTQFKTSYVRENVPVPKPGPSELLVRVATASLCHTDSMVASGVMGSKETLPLTASHEGTGTVVALGPDVAGWALGDRVMVGIDAGCCGECVNCRAPAETGHRRYCMRKKGIRGVTVDGAFAEYMLADARESNKIPDGVSLEAAAPLACAGRTVYRAVRAAKLQRGDTLALVGAGGGLGHLGIQFAHAQGLLVLAIDARDAALSLCRELRADCVLDARQGADAVLEGVRAFCGRPGEAPGEGGADATVELSGAEGATALACAVTRMHGRVVQVAQPDRVCVPFKELIFRDIRIEGSLLCSKEEGDEMLREVAEQGVQVKTNVRMGLESVKELVELAEQPDVQGKGVVVINEQAVQAHWPRKKARLD